MALASLIPGPFSRATSSSAALIAECGMGAVYRAE